jgi:hypothetical protein
MDIKLKELIGNYRGYPKEAWIAFFNAIEAGQSIEQARITADISPGALLRTLEDDDRTFGFCFGEALYKGGHFEKCYPNDPEAVWLEGLSPEELGPSGKAWLAELREAQERENNE